MQGDYAAIIEFGSSTGRTYSDLAPALKELTGAFPIRWIRGVKNNTLARDIETLKGARLVVCCGETPLAFMAAYYAKPMIVATSDDNAGGMFRAQLFPALQPDGTGYVKAVRLNGGDGVDIVAERIIETLYELFPSVKRSTSRESDTVVLTTKPVEEPKKKRQRKGKESEPVTEPLELVADEDESEIETEPAFSGLADGVESEGESRMPVGDSIDDDD
jgi:hypothetical protein